MFFCWGYPLLGKEPMGNMYMCVCVSFTCLEPWGGLCQGQSSLRLTIAIVFDQYRFSLVAGLRRKNEVRYRFYLYRIAEHELQ